MSFCFLTGSPLILSGKAPALKVVNYIEYITYDFKNKKINLTGDFLVQNCSWEKHCLRGIHRGNMSFHLATDNWLKDEYWTALIKKVAALEIGLEIENEQAFFNSATGKRVKINLALNSEKKVEEWGPPRPSDESYTYFSTWESPALEPREFSLFRIEGTLAGDTFHKLLPNPTTKIAITGGRPLLEEIERDLDNRILPNRDEYNRTFEEFKEKYYCSVGFYNVFFEGTQKEHFTFVNGSSDIRTAKSNLLFRDRRINWYWSSSDFNIHAGTKGPVLEFSSLSD